MGTAPLPKSDALWGLCAVLIQLLQPCMRLGLQGSLPGRLPQPLRVPSASPRACLPCTEVEEGVCTAAHPDGPHHVGPDSRQHPGSLRGHTKLPSSAHSCFTGYVNHSLSVFYTKDFQDPAKIEGSENVTECRFGPPPPVSTL